jgi:hypothetical protein
MHRPVFVTNPNFNSKNFFTNQKFYKKNLSQIPKKTNWRVVCRPQLVQQCGGEEEVGNPL